MTTRLPHGITKPIQKLKLHVDTPFPMPSNYLQAFKDPNWLDTMKDEFNALVSNQMWVLVSRLAGVSIFGYSRRMRMQMDIWLATRLDL